VKEEEGGNSRTEGAPKRGMIRGGEKNGLGSRKGRKGRGREASPIVVFLKSAPTTPADLVAQGRGRIGRGKGDEEGAEMWESLLHCLRGWTSLICFISVSLATQCSCRSP